MANSDCAYVHLTGAQSHTRSRAGQQQQALQLAVPAALTCLPRLLPESHSPRLPRTRPNQLGSLSLASTAVQDLHNPRKNKEHTATGGDITLDGNRFVRGQSSTRLQQQEKPGYHAK